MPKANEMDRGIQRDLDMLEAMADAMKIQCARIRERDIRKKVNRSATIGTAVCAKRLQSIRSKIKNQ